MQILVCSSVEHSFSRFLFSMLFIVEKANSHKYDIEKCNAISKGFLVNVEYSFYIEIQNVPWGTIDLF